MIGIQSTMALSQAFFPELAHMLSHIGVFGHSHSHGHSHGEMVNINAAWLAAGSIVIKEWLYRATMKVAKQKRSGVLASNAYHHRVDSLTAFVALVTISASHFLTGAQWLDPVGGLVISGMIVQAGFVNTKSALLELADAGLNDEIKDKVSKAADAALQDAAGSLARVHGVQGIKSGQNILVEIAVTAPRDWTLSKMNEVEASLREQVAKEVRGVKRIAVHFSDAAADGSAFEDQFVVARSSDGESNNDARQTPDHSHSNGHSKPLGRGSSRQED